MKATLTAVRDETDTIKTFYFDTEEPLDYIAGHFIELTVPHDHPDSKGIRRWFTLSSSPSEKHVSITVRCRSGSSFKQALQALPIGSQLIISDSMGDFVLPLHDTIPLVWLAGGIGITPFRSMARWLADNQERRQIDLFHAISDPLEAVLFDDVFQSAGISEHRILCSHDEQRLTADQDLLRIVKRADDQQPLWFISGPEPFVRSVSHDLRSLGVGPQDIIIDEFLGYH